MGGCTIAGPSGNLANALSQANLDKEVVALDPPGHGRSAQRSNEAPSKV
jgi:pimeloyl-ACP methyl ester carboxylesterase